MDQQRIEAIRALVVVPKQEEWPPAILMERKELLELLDQAVERIAVLRESDTTSSSIVVVDQGEIHALMYLVEAQIKMIAARCALRERMG